MSGKWRSCVLAGIMAALVLAARVIPADESRHPALRWPVPAGTIVHTTGPGIDRDRSVLVFRADLVIATPTGSPFVCPLAGTVVSAGFTQETGGYLVLSHQGGRLFTTYSGLMSVAVGEGSPVAAGDRLGTIGLGTGPSVLRFQLWDDNRLVEPVGLFVDIPAETLRRYEAVRDSESRRVRELAAR
jgi:murein DD-endopeptidase MepM/ murein hydrolase activator NlpD